MLQTVYTFKILGEYMGYLRYSFIKQTNITAVILYDVNFILCVILRYLSCVGINGENNQNCLFPVIF